MGNSESNFMKKLRQILKSWKQKIIQDLSLDEAFRYLAVINRASQQKIKWGSILEIVIGVYL